MRKNFRVNIILRAILLSLMICALAYCLFFTKMYVVIFLVSLTVVGIVVELIRYVDKTNRDIASFLLSIKHDDYSTTFHDKRVGNSFNSLYDSLNLITDQFQQIRAEKESNFQYLQTVVKHVNVGLICFNDQGEVELMNDALRRLLGKPHFTHVDGLKKIAPDFFAEIKKLEPGEKSLIKVKVGSQLKQLAVLASEFKLQDKHYRLISMQDIKRELEAQELEAWQKLIRILTHEIMNSVTPIVSLTSTIKEMVNEDPSFADLDGTEDLRSGMAAIHKRSQGLLHFTEAYRDLTRIPQPNFQAVSLRELLEGIKVLFTAELEEKGVQLHIRVPDETLSFQADPELIEQVLINLVQNGIDVLTSQKNGFITLAGSKNENDKTHIRVTDNGPGISPEVIDQVFVPFFTTKSTGSGIGLNLSRQIMRLHKGSISVESEEGEGTEFTLEI